MKHCQCASTHVMHAHMCISFRLVLFDVHLQQQAVQRLVSPALEGSFRAAIAATGKIGGSAAVLYLPRVSVRAVSCCRELSGCMELAASCSLCISKQSLLRLLINLSPYSENTCSSLRLTHGSVRWCRCCNCFSSCHNAVSTTQLASVTCCTPAWISTGIAVTRYALCAVPCRQSKREIRPHSTCQALQQRCDLLSAPETPQLDCCAKG